MLNLLLILAVFAVVGFLVFVAMQPNEFVYERSALISAPVDIVFSQVNNLQTWQEFSPWAKLDPKANTTFEGPVAGPGAKFSWDGNNQVGAGTMTVLDSRKAEFVKFQLDFRRPFAGTNIALFTFSPEGPKTKVVWRMTGTSTFIPKAIGTLINCKKMIEAQFDQGLANLDEISQKAAAKAL